MDAPLRRGVRRFRGGSIARVKPVPPLVLAGLALMLAGCASAGASAGITPSVTPTAACPEQPGVELPADCVGYDPDSAMALNDRYRQRMELPDDASTAAQAVVPAATQALEALRAADDLTEDAVRTALESVGLRDVQTRSGAGDVLFGAVPPEGGCVYGAVEAEQVTVDVGGYILDGGCLPAQ
jgi:hypothetical protein